MKRSLVILLLILAIIPPSLTAISESAISQTSKLLNSLIPPPPQQDLALVAALDGTVYLVDTSGRKIRWSFSTGSPIYSSYQATSKIDDDKHNASELRNDMYYVDCGEDWELYLHSTRFGKLRKLSLSAEEYVRMTPHVSDDGEITLGLKKTTVFVVDAKTGKVVHTYGSDVGSMVGVQGVENAVLLAKENGELFGSGAVGLGMSQHLIYVMRTDYVLQHYSPNSSEVLWNVAFANIEAEFRCHGMESSFDGQSLNAENDMDEIDWKFPCQMKTNVLRVHDKSMLDFDKLVIALLADGPRFLPAPDHSHRLGSVHDFQQALPTNFERPMLALPSSEPNLPAVWGSLGDRLGITNAAHSSSDITWRSHVWAPLFATIFFIMSMISYFYLAFKRQRKLTNPTEEIKMQTGITKKKKSRRSGNSKSTPQSLKSQKMTPSESENGNSNGYQHIEENGKNRLFTHTNLVDGRKIGKLLVSNKEIAKGSNGTVVLEGIYDGRSVAVKRLVQTHHDVAVKEIQNLIASDQHPNIVRWYGVEHDQDFVYLALERCTCSLSDFIYVHSESFQNRILLKDQDLNCLPEHTVKLHSVLGQNGNVELWKGNGYPSLQLLKLMRDVVAGLAHLHELGIIHRDLKPHNVLILSEKKSLCAKLSDMGISKRLSGDMSSLTHHATGSGSSGWQAPEQLLQGRQSRAIDLFSLGCVLFFCITGGKHPFGDNIERDVNIVNDRKDLFLIENIPEAVDLFSRLLEANPDKRPKAQEVLNHPLFWNPERRLSFLQDVSDRVELEDRENESELLDALESTATVALNGKWDEKMESVFINNIGRYRRYRFDSIRDLLRVIRNKSHHYRELPQEIKELVGSHPEGFECYFSSRFPKLLIEAYRVIYSYCREEEFFRKYSESYVV